MVHEREQTTESAGMWVQSKCIHTRKNMDMKQDLQDKADLAWDPMQQRGLQSATCSTDFHLF